METPHCSYKISNKPEQAIEIHHNPKKTIKRGCGLGEFNRGIVIFWYGPEMDLGDLNGP